jgi:hypothetical protein
MGAYTTNAQVWYPDTSDTAELNTLMSTMASSIENGLGARQAYQEIAVGLKASCAASAFTIAHQPSGVPATVIPYAVSGTKGDFNNGFTFSGGVATIQTPGMYTFTASVGPGSGSSGTNGCKIGLQKNGSFVALSEAPMHASIWVATSATVVMNCIAGDTLRVLCCTTGSTVASYLNATDPTHVSIALIKAV